MEETENILLVGLITKSVLSQVKENKWSKIEVNIFDKYHPYLFPEHIVILYDELGVQVKRFTIDSLIDSLFINYLKDLTKRQQKWNKCIIYLYPNLKYSVNFIWDIDFYLTEQVKYFNGYLYGLYEEILNKIGLEVFPNYNFIEAKCTIYVNENHLIIIEGEATNINYTKPFTIELDDANLLLDFFKKTNNTDFKGYWKRWNTITYYLNLHKDLNKETDITFSYK